MFLRGTQILYFWTKFCISLTLMISWVHLCVSNYWVSKYLSTNPLGSKTQTSLSLFTCRIEALGWRTWALMISVFCLEWLRYGWFSISLFMVFDSPCYNVTSPLTLWAFSYTLLMLIWNVKLLLCSLDFVACIMIALSCILLLVRLNLFAASGVHQSNYTCFLCGLICSPLCVTMLWLRPMFVPSWCLSLV
jgi:hypothetical protein